MVQGSVKRGNHGGESSWAAVRNGEEGLNLRHLGSRIEIIQLAGDGKEKMQRDRSRFLLGHSGDGLPFVVSSGYHSFSN